MAVAVDWREVASKSEDPGESGSGRGNEPPKNPVPEINTSVPPVSLADDGCAVCSTGGE